VNSINSGYFCNLVHLLENGSLFFSGGYLGLWELFQAKGTEYPFCGSTSVGSGSVEQNGCGALRIAHCAAALNQL